MCKDREAACRGEGCIKASLSAGRKIIQQGSRKYSLQEDRKWVYRISVKSA